MEHVARHVFVAGHVQGVAFRWAARQHAQGLGLRGWVRNLEDGRVEAWIEGPETQVGVMLAWLRRGPTGARVQSVQASPIAPAGHTAFEIERSRAREH